jgi:hypothetical protein
MRRGAPNSRSSQEQQILRVRGTPTTDGSRLLASPNNIGADACFQFLAEVIRILPYHMSSMLRVEVKVIDVRLPATPDDLTAKAPREPSLKIDALSLPREVGNNEFGTPDFA